jgi:predicted transcriptional regulator of viral defense system
MYMGHILMSGTQTDAVLDLARERGIIAAHDLEEQGLPRRYLSRLHERGELDRVGRGLYALPDREITEHHDLALVARRLPDAVICLLSALRFYNLTTQAPFEVWVALSTEAWEPTRDTVPLRTVRLSGEAFTAGIAEHVVDRVPVRLYAPAKTVADCFKFRNQIGLEVALEALREYWQSRTGSIDEVWHYAGICRVQNVMRPYLEALSGGMS